MSDLFGNQSSVSFIKNKPVMIFNQLILITDQGLYLRCTVLKNPEFLGPYLLHMETGLQVTSYYHLDG